MNEIIKECGIQKADHVTRMQLEEPGWRSATQEEKQAFLGYALYGEGAKKGVAALQSVFFLTFVISIAQLTFGRILKSSPSYDSWPLVLLMIVSALLLFMSVIFKRVESMRRAKRLMNCIFTVDAIAVKTADGQVSVTINDSPQTTQIFALSEAVSPTDYVYQEDGTKKGFRVVLFVVIQDGICKRKVVLGSHGISYYAARFQKSEKRNKRIASAEV